MSLFHTILFYQQTMMIINAAFSTLTGQSKEANLIPMADSRAWARDAIAAFLMDDASRDVDPERASKRSAAALKRAFTLPSTVQRRFGSTNTKAPQFNQVRHKTQT